VQELGCDFLVCSAYKFFGPHMGALYGRYDQLDRLRAYRVRPASDVPPGKFETGTQNHEGIAGVLGALEYLEWLGSQFGTAEAGRKGPAAYTGRRLVLKQAMSAIRAHELGLSRALIGVLEPIPGVRIHGITDLERLDQRVPTVSFTLEGRSPREVAEQLGQRGLYVWDGNYYALAVTERLGVEASGGMVRVGAVHYNTMEEVERLRTALAEIAAD
jgi:selenocysteine lyase/cysteine desulfurase